MKNKKNQTASKGSYTSGWNARRSLNLLKFSLNRPITLPHVDDDGDEEMEIVEQAQEIGLLLADIEENNGMDQKKLESVQSTDTNLMASTELKRKMDERQVGLPITGSKEKKHLEGKKLEDLSENQSDEFQVTSGAYFRKQRGSEDANVDLDYETSEQAPSHLNVRRGDSSMNTVNRSSSSEVNLFSRIKNGNSGQHTPDHLVLSPTKLPNEKKLRASVMGIPSFPPSQDSADSRIDGKLYLLDSANECADPSIFSAATCEVSPVHQSPSASVSPIPSNSCRKSLKTSSTSTASQKDCTDIKLIPESVHLSFAKPSKNICLNAQSSRTINNYDGPSKHLAASLQRGLEILNTYCQSSGLRRSSFRFSYKCGDSKSVLRVNKVDVGIQTFLEDSEVAEADPGTILCYKCKGIYSEESKDASSNKELVTLDDVSLLADKSRMQVPRVCLNIY